MHNPVSPDPPAASSGPHEQLALMRAEVRKVAAGKDPDPDAQEPAAVLPVARVVVDVDPSHLDRLWDYAVPAKLDQAAQPGVRVRVLFHGQSVDGFLWDRVARSEFAGALTPLKAVVSPEPVLSAPIAGLARAVADAYAGTLSDVLRVAVPPRHAATEKKPGSVPDGKLDTDLNRAAWAPYEGGPALLDALAAGLHPRAVWTALPGLDWTAPLAAAAHATLATGRGVVLLVPDGRDVGRLDSALTEAFGRDDLHLALTADLGPSERYRRWLALRRGQVRCVVGTRTAVYAPVADLGLIAMWDDGDPGFAERVAPYAHAREVMTLRAHREHAGALIGGHSVTAEGAQLISRRWARPLSALRAQVTAHRAMVRTAEDDHSRDQVPAAAAARLPGVAWRVARDGLQRGPVLVQTPRAGYLPSLACVRCREPAVCVYCRGPLELAARNGVAGCKWCAKQAANWQCPRCGSGRFRARAVGVARGAEELGRAFPGVPVLVSSAGRILERVGSSPALVLATPGAEPVAEDGYAAVLLLDGDLLLGLPNLRAGEQALRRWLAAAALARPASREGRVVLAAEPSAPAVQALVRWDPAGFARRELADRAELGYPPAARLAELTGTYQAVVDLLGLAEFPEQAEVLGPNELAEPGPDGEGKMYRALVRASAAEGRALAAALKAAQGVRTARSEPDFVRVRIDPVDLA
ncbi:MAG TPA: primosome assembly protein PriA [Actinocrinis sp.]|nr:primosome assembly protein PriA [Actinocrinis sp.]